MKGRIKNACTRGEQMRHRWTPACFRREGGEKEAGMSGDEDKKRVPHEVPFR